MSNKMVGLYLENKHTTPIDNEELFARAEADPDNRKQYIDEAVMNNLGLIHHLAKKRFFNVPQFCQSHRVTYDDLFSVGMIGLMKAANSFRLGNNAKFATYASACIYNEFGMYVRKLLKFGEMRSFDEPVAMPSDSENRVVFLLDVVPDPEQFSEDFIQSQYNDVFLKEFMSSLKPRERQIIHMYFHEDMTQKEISMELGISQSYISRLVKRILLKGEKLNNKLQKK